MPAGMCLRSNSGASHIADPKQALTLDEYCRQKGNHISKPIPLDRLVDYGRWYRGHALPNLEKRHVRSIERTPRGFNVVLSDGEEAVCHLDSCAKATLAGETVDSSSQRLAGAKVFQIEQRSTVYDGMADLHGAPKADQVFLVDVIVIQHLRVVAESRRDQLSFHRELGVQ